MDIIDRIGDIDKDSVAGRSEAAIALTEEAGVVTTEVRPRSRPEGRKLEHPTSLPPPPSLGKR